MPASAKVYNIGPYTGTVAQLAKITKVNMYARILLWKEGVYNDKECMTVGPIERPAEGNNNSDNRGTEEWQNISREDKGDIDHTPLILFAQHTSSG